MLPDSIDWPAVNHDTQNTQTDSPPKTTLGFAGQLIESKGLDLVIEAIGLMPPDRRPHLIIAGEDTQTAGAYRKKLEALAERDRVSDQITWLGFVDDVSQLYTQVNAVVCPSRVEPLGLVPLEAARFKIPAFANRVGGLAETVIDGQTGYLVGTRRGRVEPSVRSAT